MSPLKPGLDFLGHFLFSQTQSERSLLVPGSSHGRGGHTFWLLGSRISQQGSEEVEKQMEFGENWQKFQRRIRPWSLQVLRSEFKFVFIVSSSSVNRMIKFSQIYSNPCHSLSQIYFQVDSFFIWQPSILSRNALFLCRKLLFWHFFAALCFVFLCPPGWPETRMTRRRRPARGGAGRDRRD